MNERNSVPKEIHQIKRKEALQLSMILDDPAEGSKVIHPHAVFTSPYEENLCGAACSIR
jgi:hypothetical protein